MLAPARSGSDLRKRPPFDAKTARPVNSTELSVGTRELKGTKARPERPFLQLTMAVGAQTEPRASDPTGASAELAMDRLERPGPPNGQKQQGNEQPTEPPSKTPRAFASRMAVR